MQFEPFQGEEHKSFHWEGEQPAALLIHGFPGTPAELRPLGTALHQAGWTVQAPLLPGFGPDIETLAERQAAEWVEAVQASLAHLQQQHQPMLLVGYSMGAALALQVAAMHRLDGLVLLAPFQQFGTRWHRWMGVLLKPFFRQVQPFKKADLSDPEVREGIDNFFGGLDLDDPEVQQHIRDLSVPTSLFDQLNKAGQAARRMAGQAEVPTLIVQGTYDEVVDPVETRQLLPRLAGPLRYVELAGGHDLLRPDRPAWPQVEQTVLNFAQTLTGSNENGA
jgi:carboxylesterase